MAKETEKKKLSLFDRIAVGVGLAEVEENTAPEEGSQESTSQTEATPVATSQSGAVVGMVDQNMRQTLIQAIIDDQEANPLMKGIDAWEFSKGLKVAQGVTLQARAEHAFQNAAAFASKPLTKQHLETTLAAILEVLKQEADGFEDHLNNMIAQTVGPQEQEIASLEQANQQIDQQIEQLKLQKEENLKRINELGGDVHTERRNLDITAANFQATLEDVMSEFQEVGQAIATLPADATTGA